MNMYEYDMNMYEYDMICMNMIEYVYEYVKSGRHMQSRLFALRCSGLGGFSPIASRASGRCSKSLLQICHAGLEE